MQHQPFSFKIVNLEDYSYAPCTVVKVTGMHQSSLYSTEEIENNCLLKTLIFWFGSPGRAAYPGRLHFRNQHFRPAHQRHRQSFQATGNGRRDALLLPRGQDAAPGDHHDRPDLQGGRGRGRGCRPPPG